jgi:glycosyltransferase involved in cell wall biosynthesis
LKVAALKVGILGHLLDVRPGFRQAGVSRYIAFLVDALPSASPDRFVVYVGPQAGDTLPRRSGLRWVRGRLPTGTPEVRIAWEQLIAPALLARDGIDVVHAPVNVSPHFTSRPTVVTVHDLAFRLFPEQYPGLKRRYLDALTRRSVEQADQVIAVSDNTRADLLRAYRVHPERVHVVPNGVDPSLQPINDPTSLAQFRARHQLPDQFILALSTLQPRKNLITLLRAWARLDASSRLPLVVAGAPGWKVDPIFEEVRALGIADQMRFAGYAASDELALWYSAATLFVYPSLYEGFGLPVLEAMACGTPVVSSNASSLPEVAGDAALLVDPRDVDGLAAAIDRLAQDPTLRASLAKQGIERARQFSWARTARETVEVYRLAAAGRKD